MFPNTNQVANAVIDPRTTVRRKLLGSLIASGGALVLAACGGGGSDSSSADAVANRGKRGLGGGASSGSGASAPAGASGTASTSISTSTVANAAAQMQLPHEAHPNGVPLDYDWAAAPVIWQPAPPAGFTSMTGWGEIQFAAGAGTTAAADTVQMQNYNTYLLSSSGQLTLVQSQGSIDGAQNAPTFAGNTAYPTQLSNSGGITTVLLNPSEAFQFFPPNRTAIPAGTVGVITTVQAKISAPAGVTDPNINNSYILALGADWWLSESAQWSASTINNYGVGTGRFVFLTTEWQSFTFTSIQNPSAALAATTFNC
jgi:hypothetical protein